MLTSEVWYYFIFWIALEIGTEYLGRLLPSTIIIIHIFVLNVLSLIHMSSVSAKSFLSILEYLLHPGQYVAESKRVIGIGKIKMEGHSFVSLRQKTTKPFPSPRALIPSLFYNQIYISAPLSAQDVCRLE